MSDKGWLSGVSESPRSFQAAERWTYICRKLWSCYHCHLQISGESSEQEAQAGRTGVCSFLGRPTMKTVPQLRGKEKHPDSTCRMRLNISAIVAVSLKKMELLSHAKEYNHYFLANRQ